MKVLVLGANGFIGTAIVAALQGSGIEVCAVVRDPTPFSARFPDCEVLGLDLSGNQATDPTLAAETWDEVLVGIDAVVNAAGVLQPRRKTTAWDVHLHAPDALFSACEKAGVRRVVQISAVGVEESQSLFARSKLAGDRALMARDLDWTILRPAIVIGEGSYGGTSLLRALSAFPFVTPLIGQGAQELDFIHKNDLARGLVALLTQDEAVHAILEPASRERLSLRDAVARYRAWLGLPPNQACQVPEMIATAVARLGDITKLDPINSTAMAQFRTRLTGDPQGFEAACGLRCRGLSDCLAARPSETQDLWHARLYLLRPLLRFTLVLLWLLSGWVGLTTPAADYAALLAPLTSDQEIAGLIGRFMGFLDLTIAAALFVGWRLKELANVQFLLVLGYTIGLTLLAPDLWSEPLGGLLKNLPILALLLVHRTLEQER